MKKLGKVSVIARNGNLLVQTSKPQRIGIPVVDQQIKRIGKIVDVIGPTSGPYIVVNVKGYEKPINVGDVLYLMDNNKQQRPSSGKKRSAKPYHKKYSKTSSKKKPYKK